MIDGGRRPLGRPRAPADPEVAGRRATAALRMASTVIGLARAARMVDALKRLESGGIDVVVLDPELPDATGVSAFQRLRDATSDEAVVVLVRGHDDPDGLACLRAGAEGLVVRNELTPEVLEHALVGAAERRWAVRTLERTVERYALALDGAGSGLWDWDVEADILFGSARLCGLLGYPERDVVTDLDGWLGRVHEDDVEGLRRMIAVQLEGNARRFVHEYRIRSAAGDFRWVQARGVAIRDLLGRPRRMAGSLSDITERKLNEARLVHDALHDELTGLANRSLFVDRLALALASLDRDLQAHFAVLFLDLDRFKAVNDAYGHAMGDRLLVGIANRLGSFLRPGDTIARLSGDEFVILTHSTPDVKAAIHIADRLQDTLSMPFWIDGHELAVTASIGVALSRSGYASPDEILRDADIAMYRAKSSGRATVRVFDPDMQRSAAALMRLEREMRTAVAEGQLVMHYQPVVCLDSSAVVGVEALVRWNHPERGLMAPGEFLAVAEESGLIVPIGWWCLEEAARQLCSWHDRLPALRDLWLSVNVSGKLLMRVEAVERLQGILTELGLPPSALRLEITERTAVDHGEAAVNRLDDLRELGVRVGVDDFGVDYASLTSLERFRFDVLKIHPSFVDCGPHCNGNGRLLRSILGLASQLGIEVIAEGVETADQVKMLRDLLCPACQGYWFARPSPAGAVEKLLTSPPGWWRGTTGSP